MSNNTVTDQMKKLLSSYSGTGALLEQLYKKAKESSNANYIAAKKQLDEQYTEDQNTASARSMLDEKAMNQFLAARGLATSGESVQSKINSGISLNNSLTELAKQNYKSLSDLEKEKVFKETEIEKDYISKKTELASEAAKAVENNTFQNTKTETDKKNETGYVPKTSAKDLAKSIISNYAPNGSVTTQLQKSYIKQYLNNFMKTDKPDDDYIKDLVINLRAAGYSDIPDDMSQAYIYSEKAKQNYENIYNQIFSINIKSGQSSKRAQQTAKEKARSLIIGYLHNNCSTKEAFESACKLFGISQTELKEYYGNAKNINYNS